MSRKYKDFIIKIMEEIKIIQQISTICDNLPAKMKKVKEDQHKTNQQIIDSTGLSESTVKKFFSGHLSGPSIYDVTAMAIDLGLSLDELMELAPPQEDQTAELDRLRLELAHKEELLEEKDHAINRLLDRSRIQEDGIALRNTQIVQKDKIIAQKDADIKAVRKADRPLIFGLCGLCILFTFVWAIYVVLDARNPDQGLIRAGGEISAIIWLGAVCVVVLLVVLLYITVNRWYNQTKR